MYYPQNVKGGGEAKKNNVNRIPKLTFIFMDNKDILIYFEIRKNAVFSLLSDNRWPWFYYGVFLIKTGISIKMIQ